MSKIIKNEQVPYVESYPYLLPKSYSNIAQELKAAVNKEWLKEDIFKCNVQVNEMTYLGKMLNNFKFSI